MACSPRRRVTPRINTPAMIMINAMEIIIIRWLTPVNGKSWAVEASND